MNAQGQAIFEVSADGENISYKSIVADIHDVLGGPISILIGLYPDAPPPRPVEGRSDGVLATVRSPLTTSSRMSPSPPGPSVAVR